ncbi:MAG TPA: hypothetical protein VGR35_15590 [Tepidisphaeraceae bacterium]|nr:hypothetical protein [Tepidisphaeraceae bacterium]
MSKSIRVENEAEELVALQALETYRALQHAVKTAPHGRGLATVEAVVHDKGFEHLRRMYESALADHPEAPKKGGCSLGCACGRKSSFRCATPKHLLTTVGGIVIPRRYYACRGCGGKRTPWDEWAGIHALAVTPHARKVIVTVSCAWSFDRASGKLKEICHMNVSDDTIERVCQHEGEEARRWLRGNEKTVESFATAPGEPVLQ